MPDIRLVMMISVPLTWQPHCPQLHRTSFKMSTMSHTGHLGQYEVKGLLLCFLYIVKTVSEGEYLGHVGGWGDFLFHKHQAVA